MIAPKSISEKCQTCFRFLESEYGMKIVSSKIKNWGLELRYKNNFVGVTLKFELREFYLFVKISKLTNGDFPKLSGEIRSNTILNTFDLDDVVTICNKKLLLPPHKIDQPLNEIYLEHLIKNQANNLKNVAQKMLEGDFSKYYYSLNKIVKERAEVAAVKKWQSFTPSIYQKVVL